MTKSMKHLAFLLFISIFFSSCVSRKQLTYLQGPEGETEQRYSLSRTKYKVQPNDILNISFKSLDDETNKLFNSGSESSNLAGNAGDLLFYIRGFRVASDGNIELPVLGLVNVVNKDIESIKLVLQNRLEAYFKEDIFVNVQLAGIQFSVVGDVANPGRYVAYQNQLNIFQALAQAGDITIVGDKTEVMILRQDSEGVKVINLDLTDSRIIENPHFFIHPNDVINVKPLIQKSLGIGTTGFQTFASVLGVIVSSLTLIVALNNLN